VSSPKTETITYPEGKWHLVVTFRKRGAKGNEQPPPYTYAGSYISCLANLMHLADEQDTILSISFAKIIAESVFPA